jgi:hypothetical protein
MPSFTPVGGTQHGPLTVTLTCSTESATIHYTLDGSVPSPTASTYTTPVLIDKTTVVQAIAVKEGMDDSRVSTATYTIVEEPSGALPIASVSASSDDGNVPANATDGDLGSRWSAEGDGEWLQLDLGEVRSVGDVWIAWYKGESRTYGLAVQISGDGSQWSTAVEHSSSGTTNELEKYTVGGVGRYVRIVGYGNSENDWNSITEVAVGEGATGTGRRGGSVAMTAAAEVSRRADVLVFDVRGRNITASRMSTPRLLVRPNRGVVVWTRERIDASGDMPVP